MLNWCNRFNICCFLDNHSYKLAHHSIECIAGAGAHQFILCNAGDAFQQLKDLSTRHHEWLFGHFSYDLKNETEDLQSNNPDYLGFPDLYFFLPKYLIQLGEKTITIGSFSNDHDLVLQQIAETHIPAPSRLSANIRTRYSRNDYVDVVEKLKRHILRGDCYEVNFCQEFYAENVHVPPAQLYTLLSEASPNPYSAYYKHEHLSLSCMSPERYLRREGRKVLSQPIKGTSRRELNDPQADRTNADRLTSSQKERAENIMVVDLVRNDLSKICDHGTVNVDELCAVYSFPHVHQMVSTVSGTLKEGMDFTDAVKATFPMGSMTGAPKKKVMELIEKYEITKRGLFSGSIGYVKPDGDFDFNVVIRSVLYNSSTGYLSFQTGSAITFSSDAEQEYQECLLKAEAIKKALAETNTFH